MDDWLVSVVKDGKVRELYFSHDLQDMATIRALHPGSSFETCHVCVEKQEKQEEYVPVGGLQRGRPTSKSWAKRVMCVETGETWNTVMECSRLTGIPTWSLYKSVHRNCEIRGLHFTVIKNKTDNHENKR